MCILWSSPSSLSSSNWVGTMGGLGHDYRRLVIYCVEAGTVSLVIEHVGWRLARLRAQAVSKPLELFLKAPKTKQHSIEKKKGRAMCGRVRVDACMHARQQQDEDMRSTKAWRHTFQRYGAFVRFVQRPKHISNPFQICLRVLHALKTTQ